MKKIYILSLYFTDDTKNIIYSYLINPFEDINYEYKSRLELGSSYISNSIKDYCKSLYSPFYNRHSLTIMYSHLSLNSASNLLYFYKKKYDKTIRSIKQYNILWSI